MSELVISPETLQNIVDEINEIDDRLDASSNTSSGKTATRNALIREYQDQAKKTSQSLVKKLSELQGEELVALYHGVLKELESNLSDEADEALEAAHEERKKDIKPLTPEEQEEALKERNEKIEAYRLLRSALEQFGYGDEVKNIEKPRKRRVSSGSRGPNVWGKYQYSINGDQLPEEANKLSFVAKRFGMKVRELKDIFEGQGVDADTLDGSSFTVKIDDNNTVSAFVLPQYEADFETEEDGE